MANQEQVVVLHGILRSSRHMRKLSAYLRQAGFSVCSIDYPSTSYPIEQLIDIIYDEICARVKLNETIHFVGYSLGGLLLRALLHKYDFQLIGRIVQLAPPNHGSEVADLLKTNWIYQKFYGPAGQQLVTDQAAFVHLFGRFQRPVGVISGSLSIDPFCSYFIDGCDDGKVSIESSKLPEMVDHIVVPAAHTFFPHSRRVQKQTVHFLKTGAFLHEKADCPLRVVVLYSAGHLGSAIILNKLLKCREIEIVGVVKSQPLSFSKKGRAALSRHLKKVGWRFGWLLFWQRCVQGVLFLFSLLLPWARRRLKPAWRIAQQNDIPVRQTHSVNDAQTIEFIKNCEADVIVSAYFNQILKPEVLQLASRGCLNVHPGWLPAYRGAMAYFWVLKKGEERAGVTVHWMDEGIDTGKTVAKRAFRIRPGATQQSVLATTAVVGGRLVCRVLRQLYFGTIAKEHSVEASDSEADGYYRMPERDDFDDYFSEKRFFRLRDTLKIFFKF